jgi:hypothetical protein
MAVEKGLMNQSMELNPMNRLFDLLDKIKTKPGLPQISISMVQNVRH